jgi:hypothetical protein
MDIKKWFIGGITAGIVFFLLGWVTFDMLLKNFMADHTGAAGNVTRAEPDFIYLAIGNLAIGFLLAYVLMKGSVGSMAGGFVTGGIVGLLMSVGYDCVIYGTSTVISKTAMAADVAAITVMAAVAGAIAAMVMGMGKKAA